MSHCFVPTSLKTSLKTDKDLCPCHRSPCSSDANGYVGSQIICRTVVVHMVEANVTLHLPRCHGLQPQLSLLLRNSKVSQAPCWFRLIQIGSDSLVESQCHTNRNKFQAFVTIWPSSQADCIDCTAIFYEHSFDPLGFVFFWFEGNGFQLHSL